MNSVTDVWSSSGIYLSLEEGHGAGDRGHSRFFRPSHKTGLQLGTLVLTDPWLFAQGPARCPRYPLPQGVQVGEHVLLTWSLGPVNLPSRTLFSNTEEEMQCSDIREGRPVYKACLHWAHGVVLPGPLPLTPGQVPGAQTRG